MRYSHFVLLIPSTSPLLTTRLTMIPTVKTVTTTKYATKYAYRSPRPDSNPSPRSQAPYPPGVTPITGPWTPSHGSNKPWATSPLNSPTPGDFGDGVTDSEYFDTDATSSAPIVTIQTTLPTSDAYATTASVAARKVISDTPAHVNIESLGIMGRQDEGAVEGEGVVPDYATSACPNFASYSSACSCFQTGAPLTIEAPTPTVVVYVATVTVT